MKPAVFDLFLSVAIAAYVGLVYLSVLVSDLIKRSECSEYSYIGISDVFFYS